MLREWLQTKVSPRSRLAPGHAGRRDGRRRVKFTPRLESLEDRTLLDGTLDPTFGVGGLVNTGLAYLSNNPLPAATAVPGVPALPATHQNSLALQPDGKIVVAGVSRGTTNAFSVGRFNPDGSLDTTFGTNGLVTTAFPGSSKDQANAVAIQADGKIVVVGSTIFGGVQEFGILRYNPNGTLDTTFGSNGFRVVQVANVNSAITQATAVAIQTDGRIVVAGTAEHQFSTTGPITNATNTGPIVISSPNHGLTTGQVITVANVGGNTAANGTWTITVIDANTFSLNGSVGNGLYSGGGSWAGGIVTSSVFAVARVYADGIQDSDFNGAGLTVFNIGPTISQGKVPVSQDALTSMALQPDGQIVVAGYTNTLATNDGLNIPTPGQPHTWNFAVARLNKQNGLLDSSFAGGIVNLDFFHALFGGKVYGWGDDMAEDVLVQPDGKIVVAGRTWMDDSLKFFPNFGVARFNQNGSLDVSLNGTGLIYTDFSPDFSDGQDIAFSVGLQGDGKIVVAGTSDQASLNGRGPFGFALVRYNVDGSIDPRVPGTEDQNFGTHGQVVTRFPGSTLDVVTDLILLPSGQILVAGTTSQGGSPVFALARYSGLQSGSFQFSQAAYGVNENGGSVTITVTRGGGTENIVTVAYATSDGTAKAGINYTATSGSLTFAAGQATASFTVPIIDDNLYEPTNFVFNLTLSKPTGGAVLGLQSTATVTIVETDLTGKPGVLQFSAAAYSVAENAGSITLTVTQSSTTVPITVSYATSDGTARAGTDYTASTGTITFAPGQTTATITIPIVDDGVFTVPNKSFTVTLSNPTNGASLGNPTSAMVTLIEKDGTPNQLFIAHAYLDILGRPVDPSGLATWTNFLAAGGTRTQLAAGIMNSQEYRTLVVNNLFTQYLRRSADPGGLATYTAFLAGGGTDEAVAAALLGSQEYFQNRGLGTTNGFLSALYQDVLNRPIDASGLATFTQFLNNGGSRTQVAAIILSSTEYDTNLVQSFYQRFLRRAADPTGLNAFVTQLQTVPVAVQPLIASDSTTIGQRVTDESVIAALVGSQEYFILVTG